MNVFKELISNFHPENFLKYLGHMGSGMLTIAVVMLIIILVVLILNKATSKQK